ncbi:hypothetical protein EV383_1050 [Pseudonocardia sediminis]|uniref:Uncharacterized protein n=1 Tax=Pseudonocardia sediminis TaxID=1397368 RepID=A0A4Q7UR92_PSEST|nr:hypothetical protein [Pseudonocardia sediminis]RZT84212.1 hypothetical protein EV383_1050 [Pseudonocardia sediminis]
MAPVLDFLSHNWWLFFVFGGTIGGAVKAVAAANERRVVRRQERYRIKQETKIAIAQARAQDNSDEKTQRRQIDKSVAEHDRTDAAWFAYEIDPVTLLDFPMMTDMREPLTVDFHKARRRADLLRPSDPQSLVGDRHAQDEYREAVHAYVIAFDVAEAEAKRRRRGGFSLDEQEHLVRAQSLLRLAMDGAATPQERQNAYRRAQKELEGLMVLPQSMRAQIEQRVAGQIEA